MNAKLLVSTVLVTLALPVAAHSSQRTPVSSLDPTSIMHTDPYLYATDPMAERLDPAAVPLGDSGYVISGPIIRGVRPSTNLERPSLWKRVVMFPVRLITPQPMPQPPETVGTYFKWNELSTEPWVAIATGNPATTEDPAITHEPVPLISIGK